MESDVVRWQQNQVQGSCTMKSSVFVNSARTRKMSDGWVQKRTIKPTKDWVKMKHIDIMEWPTQSPHLSPIWKLRKEQKLHQVAAKETTEFRKPL